MTVTARRADVCIGAMADCFADDGEIFASPMGTVPTVGARLARATFAPDLYLTDGVATAVAGNLPLGAPPGEAGTEVEGWMPFRLVFDTLWWGRRHVVMGASQIDPFGNQNISAIGDWARPTVQLLGIRGAPGNTINHRTSYWVASHTPKAFVPTVDVVSGIGWDRKATLGESGRFVDVHRVVTNLAVLDFETPDHRMRLRSVHPGVTVDDVVAATGFELVIQGDVPGPRTPDESELALIREVLDPSDTAAREVPE